MSVNMLDPWNRTPYGSHKEVTGNCKVMGEGGLRKGVGWWALHCGSLTPAWFTPGPCWSEKFLN